jgi:hypothetical protein
VARAQRPASASAFGIRNWAASNVEAFLTFRDYCSCHLQVKLVWETASGKLLLGLVSTAILGSGTCGTHDHILLSDNPGRGFISSLTALALGSALQVKP